MIYKYEECDLFCVPSSYYLVQCISADFAMGAGIAVQFNKHFNVKENLKKRYGNVVAEWDGSWTKGFCVQDGRVFNLVTKRNYFHKPTEETMRNALLDLREQAKEQRIKMLAMPKIGAGLDKMPWKVVLEQLQQCDENAEVYILPEGYNPLDTGGSFEILNIYCIMNLAKAEHEVYISEY